MNPPRAVWVALVLAALATAAALGYQRESLRLRRTFQEEDQKLQTELEGALTEVIRLCEASAESPSLSGSGDTLYLHLASAQDARSAPRLNRLAIYVDKNQGGLWLCDGDGQPRLLSACVDRIELEPDRDAPTGSGWLVALSAIHPAPGFQASRRSMCRYVTYRCGESGDRG